MWRILAVSVGLAACTGPARERITVTFLDGGSVSDQYSGWGEQALEQFTRETGVAVRRLPGPESANDQFGLQRKLLESRASTPDVYLVDGIWSGALADHLSDLAIQSGERAKGRKDFWGFVWQGAAYEGLTCNALEWQVAEGGGRIVEDDGTISVGNPATVRALERAARWVGTISPPSVVAYLEIDSRGIWQSGNAAFMRGWPANYATGQAADSRVRDHFRIAPLPAGRARRAATLGENALAVSRYSQHPQEALALVRYLTRRDVQRSRLEMASLMPTAPDLYDDPLVLKASPQVPVVKEVLLHHSVARPAAVTGAKYPEVSEAFARAVHSVLTGRQGAAKAVSGLEQELSRITGFPVRPARTDPR